MATYLGLDLGTTAAKGVIVSDEGQVVARARVPALERAGRGPRPGRSGNLGRIDPCRLRGARPRPRRRLGRGDRHALSRRGAPGTGWRGGRGGRHLGPPAARGVVPHPGLAADAGDRPCDRQSPCSLHHRRAGPPRPEGAGPGGLRATPDARLRRHLARRPAHRRDRHRPDPGLLLRYLRRGRRDQRVDVGSHRPAGHRPGRATAGAQPAGRAGAGSHIVRRLDRAAP